MHRLSAVADTTKRLYAGFMPAPAVPYGALTDRRTMFSLDANDVSAACRLKLLGGGR